MKAEMASKSWLHLRLAYYAPASNIFLLRIRHAFRLVFKWCWHGQLSRDTSKIAVGMFVCKSYAYEIGHAMLHTKKPWQAAWTPVSLVLLRFPGPARSNLLCCLDFPGLPAQQTNFEIQKCMATHLGLRDNRSTP
jgi:hypothetical protein